MQGPPRILPLYGLQQAFLEKSVTRSPGLTNMSLEAHHQWLTELSSGPPDVHRHKRHTTVFMSLFNHQASSVQIKLMPQ